MVLGGYLLFGSKLRDQGLEQPTPADVAPIKQPHGSLRKILQSLRITPNSKVWGSFLEKGNAPGWISELGAHRTGWLGEHAERSWGPAGLDGTRIGTRHRIGYGELYTLTDLLLFSAGAILVNFVLYIV